MSVRLMAKVWDSDLPRDQKYVLLAYADHANDEGDGVYPSLGYMEYKTGYVKRHLQRITQALVNCEILIPKGWSRLGTKQYKIDSSKLPQRPPYEPPARGRPANEPDGQDESDKTHDTESMNFEPDQNKFVDIPDKFVDIPDKLDDSGVHQTMSLKPSVNEPSDSRGLTAAGEQTLIGGGWLFGGEVKNPRAQKALVNGANKFGQAEFVVDVSAFPETTQATIRAFCQAFYIHPPARPAKGGGEFALWITESAELEVVCGEFGLEVINMVAKDRQAAIEKNERVYTVARPGAIIKAARSKVGDLRAKQAGNGSKPDLDQHLADLEAQRAPMRAEIARAKAEAARLKAEGDPLYNKE